MFKLCRNMSYSDMNSYTKFEYKSTNGFEVKMEFMLNEPLIS